MPTCVDKLVLESLRFVERVPVGHCLYPETEPTGRDRVPLSNVDTQEVGLRVEGKQREEKEVEDRKLEVVMTGRTVNSPNGGNT